MSHWVEGFDNCRSHVNSKVKEKKDEKGKKQEKVTEQMWRKNPMRCDISPVDGTKYRSNYDRIFGTKNEDSKADSKDQGSTDLG